MEKSLEVPIYPAVIKALGDEFADSVPETYNYSVYDIHDIGGGLSFDETVKFYCMLKGYDRND